MCHIYFLSEHVTYLVASRLIYVYNIVDGIDSTAGEDKSALREVAPHLLPVTVYNHAVL
uniref:Uncharacterized protein n=1 Tax=mine drainage metagenome TaxID=410659 RepID=E6PN51_9ZZZZ